MNIYSKTTETVMKRIKECLDDPTKAFRWVKPWSGGPKFPVEYTQGTRYHGVNRITLDNGEYITFKRLMKLKQSLPPEQAETIRIRKGCHANPIFFFTTVETKDKDGNVILDSNGNPKKHWISKGYLAFHRDDIENLPSKYPARHYEHTPVENELTLSKAIASYLTAENIEISFIKDGSRCFYDPSSHSICLPQKEEFKSPYDYYGTILHEIAHSTSKGLDRSVKNAYGSKNYSREELVAEIASQTLLSEYGIVDDSQQENSAAYLKGWLSYLKDDEKELVKAACLADKAAQYFIQRANEEILRNTPKHNISIER